MNWQDHLAQLSREELYDLVAYLYGSQKIQNADDDTLIQLLLHGKRSKIFQLIDKDAYKTLRRLVRHPDRPVSYRYYPVEQLLELHIIEECANLDNDEEHGWYEIRPEALPFAQKVAKTRYYDPLVEQLQKQDEILLGLLHTFGLLELHQCVEMMRFYGIEIDAQHLFSAITWRLSLREHLQAFQVKQRQEVISFIMMRDMDFITTYQGIRRFPHIPYLLDEEVEMRSRKDRYYAITYPQIIELMEYLQHKFSHRFILTIVHELIDTYQYHIRTFTCESMIYRVFKRSDIDEYLVHAIDALPDIYRKGCAKSEMES